MSKQRLIPGIQMPATTPTNVLEEWVDRTEDKRTHAVDTSSVESPIDDSSSFEREIKPPTSGKRLTKRLMIEIDADLARKMKMFAVNNDVTLSKIAETAIRRALAKTS